MAARKRMRRSIRRDAWSDRDGDGPRPSGTPPPTINLRHLRAEEALAVFEAAVARHAARGTRELLVVHGRGHGSPGGRPVIGPMIRKWCEGHPGAVTGWREAPRDWGGAGASVVGLRGAGRVI